MLTSQIIPHKTIDLSSLRCPHLLITTIYALRTLEPGQTLKVLATDLNAPSSLGAWSRQSGHELVEMYDDDGTFVFFLRRHHLAS